MTQASGAFSISGTDRPREGGDPFKRRYPKLKYIRDEWAGHLRLKLPEDNLEIRNRTGNAVVIIIHVSVQGAATTPPSEGSH